ncbi:MAG: CPBP family intramembrane glutamic endopeptidase [Pseudomonadota bacterium]
MITTSWPRWAIALITITVFFVVDTYIWLPFKTFWDPDAVGYHRLLGITLLRYSPWLLVPLLAASLFFGPKQALASLGFNRSLPVAFAFALLCTSIMTITFLVTGSFSPPEDLFIEVMTGSFLPGTMEEVFYRAFLFGFLFRFAGMGFLPSALLGAIVFGAGHLYQGGSAGEAAGIFAITATGGLWFAWLYTEWDFNIWVPISFHVLMNLIWSLFDVSDTAMGDAAANNARLGVIVLSIMLTLILSRRGQGRVISTRGWIWGGPRD